MSFGYKTAWFAFRSPHTEAVAHALGLRRLRPAAAEVGIAAGYREPGKVFVTPPIDGWTLAMSSDFLAEADGTPPAFAHRLPQLSAELGIEVQFFASHRVVEAHAWARATQGQLNRAYLYNGCNGEVLIDLGEPTSQEIALGQHFFNPAGPEAGDDAYWEREDLRFANEDDVMRVAGAWGVNPQDLDALREGFLADGEVPAPAPVIPAPTPAPRPWWQFWK